MVLTNLKLKLKQTGCANNYFLNYLISADDHTFSKNEIASYPPYSAALWGGGGEEGVTIGH